MQLEARRLGMTYGIESPLPHPPAGCLRIEAAASRFDISADQLKEYAHEGLLVSLKSSRGDLYYSDRDYRWIHTVRRLQEEAHLSFDGIRQLLVSGCACWKFRHCDFHSKNECPLITDPLKPCWVNRAMCPVLCSYPCYSCIVYRSAPDCEALRVVLNAPAPGMRPTAGHCGG
jgi:hypothetical protein